MKVKDIISEDFINYKKPSMTILFPYCTFKCGMEICQNSELAKSDDLEIEIKEIINMYISNTITEAIVFQGLEPFDSWEDVKKIVSNFRKCCDDDIVIYTGYNKNEINDKIEYLLNYKNIIIKYGRIILNEEKHYDNVLGVYLASNNQYAEKIS